MLVVEISRETGSSTTALLWAVEESLSLTSGGGDCPGAKDISALCEYHSAAGSPIFGDLKVLDATLPDLNSSFDFGVNAEISRFGCGFHHASFAMVGGGVAESGREPGASICFDCVDGVRPTAEWDRE